MGATQIGLRTLKHIFLNNCMRANALASIQSATHSSPTDIYGTRSGLPLSTRPPHSWSQYESALARGLKTYKGQMAVKQPGHVGRSPLWTLDYSATEVENNNTQAKQR